MWCQRPGMSVKRRSRIFASYFFANARKFLASAMKTPCGKQFSSQIWRAIANIRQADRLLQSVALCRPKSLKPVGGAGNSIVLIAGITRLYTEAVSYQGLKPGIFGTLAAPLKPCPYQNQLTNNFAGN